jgi:hypothetical protein
MHWVPRRRYLDPSRRTYTNPARKARESGLLSHADNRRLLRFSFSHGDRVYEGNCRGSRLVDLLSRFGFYSLPDSINRRECSWLGALILILHGEPNNDTKLWTASNHNMSRSKAPAANRMLNGGKIWQSKRQIQDIFFVGGFA